MRRKTLVLGATSLLAIALLWACGGGGGTCTPGYEGCPCAAEQPACQAGLSCISNTCVDPNSQSGTGGSSSGGGGIDTQACTSCWDSACGSQREACTAASPCGEVADCAMNCFGSTDTTCAQSCVTSATDATAEATQAYTNLWACVSTSCVDECFTVSTGTGGSGTGTGGTDGSGGDISFLPPTAELRPLDGWVHLEENTWGIQGSIYTFSDFDSNNSAGSTAYPVSFEDAGRSFCINGQTATVPCTGLDAETCDFDSYWGAGAGINLSEAPDAVATPFNASTAGITGFSFNVTGLVPAGLRFKATVAGQPDSDYCLNISSGANSVSLAALESNCWNTDPDYLHVAPDSTQLVAIQWAIPATDAGPRSYDFCIENITAF